MAAPLRRGLALLCIVLLDIAAGDSLCGCDGCSHSNGDGWLPLLDDDGADWGYTCAELHPTLTAVSLPSRKVEKLFPVSLSEVCQCVTPDGVPLAGLTQCRDGTSTETMAWSSDMCACYDTSGTLGIEECASPISSKNGYEQFLELLGFGGEEETSRILQQAMTPLPLAAANYFQLDMKLPGVMLLEPVQRNKLLVQVRRWYLDYYKTLAAKRSVGVEDIAFQVFFDDQWLRRAVTQDGKPTVHLMVRYTTGIRYTRSVSNQPIDLEMVGEAPFSSESDRQQFMNRLRAVDDVFLTLEAEPSVDVPDYDDTGDDGGSDGEPLAWGLASGAYGALNLVAAAVDNTPDEEDEEEEEDEDVQENVMIRKDFDPPKWVVAIAALIACDYCFLYSRGCFSCCVEDEYAHPSQYEDWEKKSKRTTCVTYIIAFIFLVLAILFVGIFLSFGRGFFEKKRRGERVNVVKYFGFHTKDCVSKIFAASSSTVRGSRNGAPTFVRGVSPSQLPRQPRRPKRWRA